MNYDKLIEEVRCRVDEKRFQHTLSVAEECDRLAQIYGLSDTDKEKLHISALLHDITKQYTAEQHLEICKKHSYCVSAYMKLAPKTFHAVTGAYTAKDLFPSLIDDTVFNNITAHTTGKENMTLQQKLLYLADYIEPGRTFEDCVILRELFYKKINSGDKYDVLDEILLISFDMTIKDLLESCKPIASDTTSARNYLIMQKYDSKSSKA